MAYVAPTSPTFKLRYPEFDPVNDALINMVLSESIGEIGESWCEKDRARGQMLLAAHTLSCEGYPGKATEGASTTGFGSLSSSTGSIIELQDRDARVKFSDHQADINNNAGNGEIGETVRNYLKTTYGQQFLRLLRRNSASIAVV